jgi:hypothetical protein
MMNGGAVRTALDRPTYRRQASWMADEFYGIDTQAEILRIKNSRMRQRRRARRRAAR